MFRTNTIRPERFFIVTALLFGSLYILLTPPLQVPDEINHFYRAYQVSLGNFTATRTSNRLGGELPVALGDFTKVWERIIGDIGQHSSLREIRNSAAIVLKEDRAWYDFPNTAIYHGVNYLPQALGILICRLFTSSVLYIYYGTRFFTFIFWLLLAYKAIKLIPGKQWLMTAIVLLPMSLYINSSLSADIMINSLSLLFTGLIFHIRAGTIKLNALHWFGFMAWAVLIAQLKLVYLPLLLLVFLIPPRRFSNKGGYRLYIGVVLLLAFLSAWWSTVSVDRLYIPYAEYAEEAGWVHLAEGANKDQQLKYVLQHLLGFGKTVVRSMVEGLSMYSQGYIGRFGWLEFGLPGWLIGLSYSWIIVLSVVDKGLHLSAVDRIWLVLAFLGMIIILVLSQYVIWTGVGSDLIINLQGRYFIPVFVLLWLLIPSSLRFKAVPILAGSLIIFINSWSLILVYQRFFIP